MKAKKYKLTRQKTNKPKFWQNENYDFLTACHEIKTWWTVIHFHPCNPVLYFQTTVLLSLYNLFVIFSCIFGGIWRYNMEVKSKNFRYFGGTMPFKFLQEIRAQDTHGSDPRWRIFI